MNKKCIRLFLSVFLVSLACVFTFSQSVSAVSLARAGNFRPTTTTTYMHFNFAQTDTVFGNLAYNSTDLWFNLRDYAGFSGNPDITGLGWTIDTTIPLYSLVSFDITWQMQDKAVEYYGLQLEEGVMLADSCLDKESTMTAEASTTSIHREDSFTCHYLLLTREPNGVNSFHTPRNSRIFKLITQANYYTNPTVDVFISPGTWLELSNQSLSTSDRQWLLEHMPSGSSQADIESAVENAISSAGVVSAQNATTNAVNNLNLSVQEQTEQEQSQYESEKQEEAEREEQGKDDADELGATFNFQVRNPFMGIFGLFATPSQCVSLPTIAGWLRSPSSTYCAWFPASVRNVLTPVFAIAASMILFGFIVRGFLRKGNFSGGIEV